MLFIILAVLNNGVQWDFQEKMFGIKVKTFERMVIKFIQMSQIMCMKSLWLI